jgi:hypothetical protein
MKTSPEIPLAPGFPLKSQVAYAVVIEQEILDVEAVHGDDLSRRTRLLSFGASLGGTRVSTRPASSPPSRGSRSGA